ncbi:uroporphyrinogen-III C-methyltransferase [Shewanella sp. 5_MG-2023]|uniref:uroporphyrinogen-III C-methyltransferase n=1 Tax=Shewanella sp. 5_MG-2023 TaxID=3062656 RepID=UPI0026E2B749|nr:uroporphyrinogen-III C-methyltransferase [Shewanella sp. 5_MG-2023]MDO6641314.1 uroporphyrinogen-III C-methyltransferase [Shewanella sp. 5_MG-2023]
MEHNKQDPNQQAHSDNDVIESTPVIEADKVSEPESENPSSTTQKQATNSEASPEKKHRSKSSWWVRFSILICLIIAIGGIGLSYLLWMELQEQKQQLQTQNQQTSVIGSQVTQALVEPNKRIAVLEAQQQQNSQAYQQQAQLAKSQQQLQQRVATLAQRNPNNWMASEAEYLVRMAARKLALENDPKTAASLLTSADERIEAIKDPTLLPIRRALANDLARTNSIKTTDVAGTIYAIDGILNQLDTLPLNRAKAQAAEDLAAQNAISDSVDDWQSNLAKTWHSVTDGFITIRKRTTDLEPLLAPDQQWYLVENIRNKLLQAQLALYQHDQVNYRQSVGFARTWIQQYFDLDEDKTQEALRALDALMTVTIEEINQQKFESTRLLQQLITYGELVPAEEPQS